MSQSLSQEQKERMEENRKKALELRAAKLKQQQQASTVSPSLPQQSKPNGSGGTTVPNKQFYPQQSSNQTSSSTHNSARVQWSRPTKSLHKNPNASLSALAAKCTKTGSLVLISSERFELVMEYHQPTIDAIKTIPGRQYGRPFYFMFLVVFFWFHVTLINFISRCE